MKFPFDPDKRRIALAKHGLDLADFGRIFDDEWVQGKTSIVHGEERHTIIGRLDGALVVGAYTVRGQAWRVVTMYPANEQRKKYYEQQLGATGKRSKKRAKKKRESFQAARQKGSKGSRGNR